MPTHTHRTSPRGLAFTFTLALLVAAAGCSKSEVDPPKIPPTLTIENIRGGIGDSVTFPVLASDLPDGVVAVEWTLDLRLEGITKASVWVGQDVPVNSRVFVEVPESGKPVFRFRVEADAGAALPNGELALVTVKVPGRIVQRTPFHMAEASAIGGDGARVDLLPNTGTIAVSLIYAPVVLFTFLAHFYLATLHPRFDESLSSMTDGKVSSSYAQKHYSKWYKGKTEG